MISVARTLLMISGIAALALSAGFLLGLAWITSLWPWPGYRSSDVFVASMLASAGAPIVWIAASREFAATAGGAINLFVAASGTAFFAFGQAGLDLKPAGIAAFAFVSAIMAVLLVPLFFWSRGLAFRDARPMPVLVKVSFWIFAAILILVGAALVAGRPNTFPWIVGTANAALYGWFFLGAACYFLYGCVYPVWGNAKGQLIGFLAYDLVLIVPIFQSFGTVPEARSTSLTVYAAVVVYSGLLAIFWLLIHPGMRFSSGASGEPDPARLTA